MVSARASELTEDRAELLGAPPHNSSLPPCPSRKVRDDPLLADPMPIDVRCVAKRKGERTPSLGKISIPELLFHFIVIN